MQNSNFPCPFFCYRRLARTLPGNQLSLRPSTFQLWHKSTFLMILVVSVFIRVSELSCTWKYVDDVSLSEGLVRNSNSTIQASLDTIASWSSSNWMKLNAKKCKEMRICFLKDPIELPHLKIDDQQLELVTSHKVLGLVIQNNLKWNNHIESIFTKASKRLHILRVLRRGGVEINDLISIYSALIRSLLEYCCVVWHHALPSYLSQELERIQKRAFKIIVPTLSYSEALHFLNLRTLDE